MTTRQQRLSTVAVLAAGALILSACTGSAPVADLADVDRPDVAVDVHEGAACESIPQDVLDRHAPDVEEQSLDSVPALAGITTSACAWSDGDPQFLASFDFDMLSGTEIVVALYEFDDPRRANERYEGWYDASFRPVGPAENGIEYGPVHEIAIGDRGLMQAGRHLGRADGRPVTGAGAAFIAGDTIAEILIVDGGTDPWTEDEMLAALSDIVVAFGT